MRVWLVRNVFFVVILSAFFSLNCKAEAAMGANWGSVNSSASWRPRAYFQSVVLSNKMWIFGGSVVSLYTNDVWSSPDGVNWSQETDAASWSSRAAFEMVMFSNKIWVFGGYPNASLTNDVWSSTDGVTWTLATDSASWTNRYSFQSVVFSDKMWVMGGRLPSADYTNDVWFSSDGTNWTLVTSSAPWSARYGLQALVFSNKIWVMGGRTLANPYTNDVWSSADGTNWTLVTTNAGWVARYVFRAVVFSNKMWILGGRVPSTDYTNDVWYSSDGVNWILATNNAQWSMRNGLESLVFSNKMWVLGGWTAVEGVTNDVWSIAYSPELASPSSTNVGPTNATLGGDITATNFASVTERGVYWSTNSGFVPPGSGTKVSETGTWGTGTFALLVTGLPVYTPIYFRAYAVNAEGTGYTVEALFQTAADKPEISSPTSADIGPTDATLGGNITSTNGASVTERGVYWSTTSGFIPPGSGTKVSETGVWGTGAFALPVTGLPRNSRIYFRAFAVNSLGTGYTGQASFQVTSVSPSGTFLLYDTNAVILDNDSSDAL
jgi:hypothetical protein